MTTSPLRVGVLSFAHNHANFRCEVFEARGVPAGIWDDDAARGREAPARFETDYGQDLCNVHIVRQHDRGVDGDATQSERRWSTVPLAPRFKLGQFHQQNALAFVDALTHCTPPHVTVHDGERAVHMIAAACDAEQRGQRRTIET